MSYENTTWGKHRTASLPALNNRCRLTKLREFLGVQTFTHQRVLDIGSPNYIGESLGITDNTTGDLNYELNAPSLHYDIICCFEVLSHCYNQGILLDNIKKRLAPNGKFYLATPKRFGISTILGRGNYAETTEEAIKELLVLKGFKILRSKVYRSYPFRFVFFGFRPPIKYILHKFIILECEKV